MTAGQLNTKFEWERAFIRSRINGNTGFIGLVLSTFDNGDGRGFFASQPRLSTLTGLSERTVRSQLATLIELGWIERTRRGGNQGGKPRASEYQLTIPDARTDHLQPARSSSQAEADDRPLDQVSLDLASLQPGDEVTTEQIESLAPSDRVGFYPSFFKEDVWTFAPTEQGESVRDARSEATQRRSHSYMLREEGLDDSGQPLTREDPERFRSRRG